MTKTEALLYAKDKDPGQFRPPGFHLDTTGRGPCAALSEGVDAFRHALDDRHPIGHVGELDDIAYGSVHSASDEAKFATGGEFVIDGGYPAG